ncbi:MAG: C40 family peptidase [Faecalibacterium sp.]
MRKGYYAAARSGSTVAQTAGGKKAASGGSSATRTGVEQVIDKGKSAVSTAINGLATAAKSNAHVLVIVGVFLLLILLVMSGFSSCGILFSGTTQVSGQTIYTAEDRDIKGAEADYKKLEKELDKKIKRTPIDHPGYNEYQYHLDPIEHDPWQLTSFLTTLYDDYTRSEVQAKLQEIFKKQYKLTTWVEVQIRYKTVWVISPAGIPVPTQVPYEYKIFHTKLENRGLETVIREELDEDQWKRYKIFQETLGGRPYLFNGGLPPGGSDGSGESGIDYTVPAEALTDNEFAAIYEEAKKYVGTPYVWGGSSPETGFDCSGYVCWVYNQAGYDVGRTTANGLWNKCQKISEAEAKPGDLVFFKGTYDTPGMSHTGIYLGNGKMLSAGDPIKYADIHSSYWEKYLAGFGRLSK